MTEFDMLDEEDDEVVMIDGDSVLLGVLLGIMGCISLLVAVTILL